MVEETHSTNQYPTQTSQPKWTNPTQTNDPALNQREQANPTKPTRPNQNN